MGFLFAAGVLILYVLSLFIKMKKPSIQKPTKDSNPDSLSFDEIYNWLRAQEGPPSYSAVKDGKKKDGTQLYSIGLGHQIQPNELNLMTAILNDEQVLEIFKKDIEAIRNSMNKVIKVPINKNQQLALLSLRYNIGGPAFDKSTLLRRLNERNYSDTAMRFAEWRLSEGKINQGLVNRRERERQLFIKPV
jgi:GH24 family phage-related lysozyme (muramidase)